MYYKYFIMEAKDYLKSLSNGNLKVLINDLHVLHHEEGQLPEKSEVRYIAKLIEKDFKSYSIDFAESFIMWEVFDRFNKLV